MEIKIRLKKPSFTRLKRVRFLRMFKNGWVRVACIVIVLALVTLELNVVLQPYLVGHTYAMGNAGTVLSQKDTFLGSHLVFDGKEQAFLFNAGYNPMQDTSESGGGGAKITAKAYRDPTKGLEVSDPINEIDFTLVPKFDLLEGKQDANRIVYPLRNGTGWLVYTMQATGVKEDVVLDHANGNNMTLTYDMKLDDGFVTRLQKDGSVGVYGPDTVLTGHISTGSSTDAALLKNARNKAAKNKLYFSMPAPVAYTTTGDDANIAVHYEVHGTQVKTVARKLKQGHYPLTIDPSVTVTSTSDLFRDTNPESNADFDATTGSIARGKVTGGVIPAWTANANNLATARFLHGGAIYDDYAYVAGGAGAGSTSNLTTVEFARLSTVDQSIGTWSTTTALPTALSRFTLLAYNGYLYAIGGSTTSTSCGTDSNNVYYNRIQVNGQLSGTWTSTATLPSSVCGLGAAVYNGKMYVAGGRTGSATSTGITTAAYATINPNGSLGSFTSDDSTLPAARFDADLRIYNGYAYLIGGNLNGTLTNTVLYAPLASDGSLYGGAGTATWKSASSFGTARSNGGSSFTATNDGYMYVQGGCSAYTSDSCTTVRNEVQTAQINADGTLGPWSDVATTIASLSRVGNTIALWRGTIYSFAGCTGMTAGVVSCVSGSTINTQSYSKISDPGQVGPVNSTTAIPTAMFAHGSVVNAGRIYVVGGCIKVSCETGTADTTGNTSYATLNADGTIGSWTTDSTNLLNGATGLAAFGMAVYNNYLYATGGYTSAGASRNVYYVQLNASTGALTGAWTTQTNKLGATTTYNSAVAYRDFLFVFGGCINSTTGLAGCNTYRNTNYRMPLSAGVPGTLTTSAATGNFLNLPTAKGLMAPALYNGYIYLAGGATGAVGQTNIIFYARILDNGNITAWLGTSSGVNGTTAKLAHNLRRADAVGMNGYLYVFGGHDGGGPTTYGDIEIGKIDMSTGDISGSTLTNSVIQITPRWDERAVFSNGYMYATGGCSVGDPPNACSTMSTLTEYVEVFNAGNKGTSTWSNSSNVYSGNLVSPASTAYNGYIYRAGGCSTYTVGTNFSNPFCTANVNTTAYAPLNPDGTIGTWTPGTNLTASNSRGGGCLVQQGGYLYYIGGEDNAGNGTAIVLYSQIGANGVPGSWTQATNGIPAARSWHGCGTFGNRIYVTGGMDTSGTEQFSVYYSPLLASGGDIGSAWSTATSFTGIRAHHTTVIVGGYLFVMGGDDGTSALYDVQSIAIDPSTGNTSGSWQYSREMPQGVSYQAAVGANGYIYLYGGRTAATACINNTYIASVNSTGRLSGWSQAVNNFTTARFGAGSAYYNGYYYLLGGNDCTSIISSNVIQYGGQQSQAMKTVVSKYADFNGDGTPRSFVGYLTNAVNNGVDIEKWRMQYKSSREAANSWGVTTTVYPLTSQLKNTVVAYDGSSADVKVVRWFQMTWDINMEQSFTFTDDTKPAISQYELYYSPPPGKRLMHGKDFRDQTQQDLEANP